MKTYPEIVELLCQERHNMTLDECLSAAYDKTLKFRFITPIPIKQVLIDANKLYAQQVAEDVRERCADNAFIRKEIYEGEITEDVDKYSILTTNIILP